ncbi:TonB-dependent receptor plug domain-containing protein [Trichlorobacter ammonificans]|uniref:TonB-dependent receptor plug domain-containing protein n=1 Tax=Trichlorobacter ammonificans TaxID=2916410 RepID=UPI0027379FB2|nr:TonB-dependent receptor [Trichlorobacter ammonificans]
MTLLIRICTSNAPVWAQDSTLGLLEGYAEETVTASRLPKPISQSAENVTVVTAAEIEAMHARTLADILNNVTGVQLLNQTGPASLAFTLVQGANFNHLQVMLDGVPLNSLADNYTDIGLVPARIIERVEIVKGAASSAWGQALGGVINIITKSLRTERALGGSLSLLQGERGTRETGAELTGGLNSFGYYLSGSFQQGDGFQPNTRTETHSLFARLSYDLPRDGQVSFTLLNGRADRGNLAYAPLNYRENSDHRNLLLVLALNKPLTSEVEVELTARQHINLYGNDTGTMEPPQPLQALHFDERTSGVGARLLWRTATNLLAVGAEYEHVRMSGNDTLAQTDLYRRRADRWGLYLNDTLTVGKLSFSPGIRLDLTGSSGEQVSPSFGVTWQVTEDTLLRAYTATGYSLPTFTVDRPAEKVWTSQVGVESSAIPWLWLKATLFRNETRDISVYDWDSSGWSMDRQVRQGVEGEFRTVPYLFTSLRGGYSFVDAVNPATGAIARDLPRHTLHLGLQYDDRRYLQGMLNGRHIWWNAADYHNGRYQGLIWDLHLTATPFGRGNGRPELLLSLRNLFNGSQYLDEAYRNPGRSIEGGVRFRF